MHAVITAGGRPALGDPLYPQTSGSWKALLDISGKPMIQWVLDALSGSKLVDSAVIIGLPDDCGLHCARPLTFLPDQGSLLENNRAGVRKILDTDPDTRYALLLTSDVPGITGAMIDWVAESMLKYDVDFLYPVIERRIMEARFPNSRRTFLKLKDTEVCGADVMAIHTTLAASSNPKLQKIIEARKSPLRQAAMLGVPILLKIFLRRLTVSDAGRVIGKRLGMHARTVFSPFAELGMDIDKPYQYQLMAEYLNRLHV